jgi:hypothetical protein
MIKLINFMGAKLTEKTLIAEWYFERVSEHFYYFSEFN